VTVVPIGFSLQPDAEFMELVDPLLCGSVDYFEVAPETLWRVDANGSLAPNGFHRRFAELGRRCNKPFVAHGVGFSVGSAGRADNARRKRWLERLLFDQGTFRFRWYTDHLGDSALGGMAITLPVAVPMTAYVAGNVRAALASMQTVVPNVGVENSVFYFALGDPLEEPRFLTKILSEPGMHLLLDLHNVYTNAQNLGFDPARYLAALDLSKVIEIHLSGGSPSDAAWLSSGEVMRLDAHDSAIPEEVWKLFEVTAPCCPLLRGVTVERMEGTVREDDVAVLRHELERARRMLELAA
jgi:uncharacterized protein (UPF0276 family)